MRSVEGKKIGKLDFKYEEHIIRGDEGEDHEERATIMISECISPRSNPACFHNSSPFSEV